MIAAHQKTQRIDPARNLSNNRFNNAIFDNVTVEKYFAEIDGIKYPKDPKKINYPENNYLNPYRDPNLFYKEDPGEQISPIISYDKMKTYYPIQIFDLRIQADYVTPKKTRFSKDTMKIPHTLIFMLY